LTFVNPKDQQRLKQIETLIEREVPRIALPPEFGDSPPWNPKQGYKSFSGKKNFQRKKSR
jgi:hypothetical protein